MQFNDTDLRHLQQTIVEAVASGRLGNGTPMPHFPDLNYVLEADEVIVSTRNLAGAIDRADRFLDHEQIALAATGRENVPFLEFTQAEIVGELVRLGVDVCLGFADVDPLRLGAIVFAFRRGPAGDWSTAEPPAALAY